VALIMVAVSDLSASGGAERQFTDLFQHFRRCHRGRVTLVTARAALERLRQAGRVADADGVIALPMGRTPARGRLGIAWMTLLLLRTTIGRGFDVVHLCLPTPSYVPYAALITRLPRAWRPRVVLTVIDCTLAHNIGSGRPTDLYEQQVVDAHRLYFRWVRLDAIYTWYRAFADTARRERLVPPGTIVRPARFCFTDPEKFQPSARKANVVVFAGRLSEQKRPWLFVEAVAVLRSRRPDLIQGWRFEMYGDGALRARIVQLIETHALGGVLTLSRTPDMAPVFAGSRLFVSTQALENFTSLAMLEAMAAGNAVVAEDVGQTREFVTHGDNGLLVSPATGDTLANAIADYIEHVEWHDRMAAASRDRATHVHTIEHFADDITSLWREVAA
jgi:glycosyltransferase involved in cell wall biosynthesis